MPSLSRLAAASLVALAATAAVHAQQQSVRPTAPTAAPSANARASQALPNPAGLRSANPAGLTAGSGTATPGNPVSAGTSAPGGPLGSQGQAATEGGFDTGVMGAGTAGVTARGPSQSVPMGSGGNPVETARAFINADVNHDGELSRNEAARLGIAFEEMDRDFDGVITRFEYGDGRR